MPDVHEQRALEAGAAALIAAYDLNVNAPSTTGSANTYSSVERMAKTMALMGLPKRLHKDSPFWNDPQVFMARLIPLFKTYPVYDLNMQASISVDNRLQSQAGVYRFDYEKAMGDLPVRQQCPDAVDYGKLSHQQFKNLLRNHYSNTLYHYYHGIAKLCIEAVL